MKRFTILAALILGMSAVLGCTNPQAAEKKVDFYSPYKGVYVVDVNVKACPNCISVYNSDSVETVERVAKKNNTTAAINAGFFDPSNRMTTSYIVKDSKVIADPTQNPDLMANKSLKPYLPQIFNRSEFRILNCNGKLEYTIQSHNDSTNGCTISQSVQAGPELVPSLRLSEEAFVVKKGDRVIKESAGALGNYARSAIAIKKYHVLIIAVDGQHGLTIERLAELVKTLNVDEAMAFDGGSSTSLYVNMKDKRPFNLVSAKDNTARRVKSMILVKSSEETK